MGKHYIRIDINKVVFYRFSDEFEQPQAGDICVNPNGGRHYNDPWTNGRSQNLYKWDGANQIPRTQAELDAELASRPAPPDPDKDLADAITAATTLDTLKAALLGNSGKLARVPGKMK